jgi:hypothetical protein
MEMLNEIKGLGEKRGEWFFEKNANDLSDILCYTHDEAQRAYRGVAVPGGCSAFVPLLFPFCASVYMLCLCQWKRANFQLTNRYALSRCNRSRISASMLLESVIF